MNDGMITTAYGVRLCISADKELVRKWAKQTKRHILWLDREGQWHAAKQSRMLPWLDRFAVKKEYV